MTPAGLRRVTFHAMGDCRKIESVLHLVTEVRLRHLLAGARDVCAIASRYTGAATLLLIGLTLLR